MSEVKESSGYENFVGKKEKLQASGNIFEALELPDSGVDVNSAEWQKHWKGMPEFEQKDNPPFKTIYLHFRNKEDFDQFVSKYKNLDEEQNITPKTKSMWYPHLDKDENSLKRWFEE